MIRHCLYICVLACIASCSPGKKLLQEQKRLDELQQNADAAKKKIAAEAVYEFVKNNPCEPPEFNLDSLCSIYYSCPTSQTPADKNIDTDTPPAADYFAKLDCVPKKILVPYKDKRTLNLLQDSIVEKDKRLAVQAALIAGKDADCKKNIDEAVGTAKKNKNALLWLLIGIALTEALVIFILERKK